MWNGKTVSSYATKESLSQGVGNLKQMYLKTQYYFYFSHFCLKLVKTSPLIGTILWITIVGLLFSRRLLGKNSWLFHTHFFLEHCYIREVHRKMEFLSLTLFVQGSDFNMAHSTLHFVWLSRIHIGRAGTLSGSPLFCKEAGLSGFQRELSSCWLMWSHSPYACPQYRHAYTHGLGTSRQTMAPYFPLSPSMWSLKTVGLNIVGHKNYFSQAKWVDFTE